MPNEIIEIEDVSKTYTSSDSTVEAVRDINFDIFESEFISIIGPTGCGKSTLLEMIAGLRLPSSGEIRYRGERILDPRSSIGIVFQENSTFPWRTVMENVTFGLELRNTNKDERRTRGGEMLDLVGLSGFEDSYPAELSGGMNQRLCIARTLITEPDVLLMDEPFGALDEQTRLLLGEELLDIWRERNSTVVFVTHSINEAVHLSDRVFVMTSRPGQLKETVNIDMNRPREEDIMGTNEFTKNTEQLWSLLRNESKEGMEGMTASNRTDS